MAMGGRKAADTDPDPAGRIGWVATGRGIGVESATGEGPAIAADLAKAR